MGTSVVRAIMIVTIVLDFQAIQPEKYQNYAWKILDIGLILVGINYRLKKE